MGIKPSPKERLSVLLARKIIHEIDIIEKWSRGFTLNRTDGNDRKMAIKRVYVLLWIWPMATEKMIPQKAARKGLLPEMRRYMIITRGITRSHCSLRMTHNFGN
jgi:hypothetical protein